MKSEPMTIVCQSVDGKVKIDVTMQNEMLRLSQAQTSQLFGRDKSVVNRHVNNILRDGELDEKVVVANFAITTPHGAMAGKTQERDVTHYSLDMILAVGYRVKSPRGARFRQSVSDIRVPHTPGCLMFLGAYPKHPSQYKSFQFIAVTNMC
ncbi:MAG: virulence RhuM family protein [Deltaproteobacteria bacterium]|jgi:hypothetical protein|nr:virulence RhuM family protein [Deltaproteobacteria bacterium]